VGQGFFPLDKELELEPEGLTPSLVEGIVLLGSWMPFAEAAKFIGHFWKVSVSEATVRRTTEKSGEAYVEVQTAQVETLEKEMPEALQGPALQQISVDGAMVPLLHKEWAEVKTMAIGTIEGPVVKLHSDDAHQGGTAAVRAQALDTTRTIWVKLDRVSYDRVLQAHKEGQLVRLTGELKREGSWWLQTPRDLQLVPLDEEPS